MTSADGRLYRSGEVVPLQELPFRLLLALVTSAGAVVSRDDLCRALWGDTVVEYEAGLNTAVKKLRDALGDDPVTPTYVETVPKRGYRLRVAVERLPHPPLAVADVPQAPPLASTRTPRTSLWVSVGAVTLSVAMAVWGLWSSGGGPSGVPRMLVLPVDGQSATPRLGAGLTDQLIAHLARLDSAHLVVLGPMTSRAAANSTVPLASLSRDLGVTHVLATTLVADADQRLAVTLTRTVDQAVVWSDVLVADGPPSWPQLSTQWVTAVARGVVVALGLPPSDHVLARASTLNHDAFDAYLTGRAAWARFDAHGLAASLEAFQQAATLDPQFVDAHVGVAEAYGLLALLQLAPSQVSLAKAMEAAETALHVEANHPAALAILAFTQFYATRDLVASAQNFERALALDPGRAMTHQWAAALFSAGGQHDRALTLARRAEELDPVSLTVNSDLCWYAYYARDFTAAAERAERAFRTFQRPGLLLCAQLAYWQLHDDRRERDALLRRLTSAGRVADVERLTAAFEAGGMPELRAADFRRLDGSDVAADSYSKAVAAASLGSIDAAASVLREFAADRPPWFAFLPVDPAFEPLRNDARFRALLPGAAP